MRSCSGKLFPEGNVITIIIPALYNFTPKYPIYRNRAGKEGGYLSLLCDVHLK